MTSKTEAARFLAAVVIGLLLATSGRAETFSTSFETDPPGDFTIGMAPITASFENGNAQTVGNPGLYVTGSHSWHVGPGVTGIVAFETAASDVDFFFRNAPGAGPSTARVIDVDDNVISTTDGTQSFINISVSRMAGETLIDRVEIENSGGASDVVVDDFSFTAEASMGGGPLMDPIPEAIPQGVEIRLTEVAADLAAPNWGTHAPNDATRLFVVDQPGQLHVVDLATGDRSVFLDLSSRLVPLGAFGPDTFDERGFLGVAFHPDYANNGLFYTYTSEPVSGAADFSTIPQGEAADHQSVVTEWVVPLPMDPTSLPLPASAREILRIDQPQFNHNAGALELDANGFLLIALGDGGGADDVDGQEFQGSPMIGHGDGNGQDTSNPLGSILRIDPLGVGSGNGQYAIPAGNPFVGQASTVEEIYAYGFRNPFRMSIDPASGDLWVADVGQNDIEEVDLVTAGSNYGWNYKEGSFFFDPNGNDPGFVTDVDPGAPAGLVDPVAEYDHDEGIAIVGGFVYSAGQIPEIDGRYVFGDFGSFDADAGRLFYLDGNDAITEFDIRGQANLAAALNGFGRDFDGNVYVMTNTTGTPSGSTGKVYRIDAGPGRLNVGATDASVGEGDGSVTIDVVRAGGNNGGASVDYTTQDGSATAGSDFEATSGTLMWAAGESGAKSITVTITEDMDTEAAETFTVELSNSSGADLGADTQATVTINDNDMAPPPPPSGGGGGGSAGIAYVMALMLMLCLFESRRRRIRATTQRR